MCVTTHMFPNTVYFLSYPWGVTTLSHRNHALAGTSHESYRAQGNIKETFYAQILPYFSKYVRLLATAMIYAKVSGRVAPVVN
jgi:hypothetical protein